MINQRTGSQAALTFEDDRAVLGGAVSAAGTCPVVP